MIDLTNNGLSKNTRNFQQARANDSNLVNRNGNNVRVIKDCVVVGVKGIGTFDDDNYLTRDEGGILLDVVLPEGKTLNYYNKQVRGIRNIRCRNTYEELQAMVGCLEEDYVGRTVDLEFTTSENYNAVEFNAGATFKNRTKRSNAVSGVVETRKSLYGEVVHMGVLFGTMEGIHSVKNKLLESFKINMLNEGV